MSPVKEQTSSTTGSAERIRPVHPVLAEVRRRLLASPFPALKQLQTEFRGGVIVLFGNVPNFHMRQVAISLVMKVDGVKQLEDCVIVESPIRR